MIYAFRHEICRKGLCSKCLGLDAESSQWRSDQSKWFGMPDDWACPCGRVRETPPEKLPRLKTSRRLTLADVAPFIELYGTEHDKDELRMVNDLIKECGCKSKAPRTQARLIADYRKYITPSTIIVGNAPQACSIDLNRFDNVVLFNKPRQANLLSYVTHHFMRTIRSDLAYHAGEELVDTHEGIPIFVESGSHGKELSRKYSARGGMIFSVRLHAKDYPQGKSPSTGYAAILYFLGLGHKVTITGFTWQGNNAHDWELEKSECAKMIAGGKIILERDEA